MAGMDSAGFQHLERFRGYLEVLARVGLDPQVRRRVSASDVVQETLLEAFKSREDCAGWGVPRQAAWLRRILAHNLLNVERDHRRGKRAIGKERSIEEALRQSSSRVEEWLRSLDPSPSEGAIRREESERLVHALSALSEVCLDILTLRFIHDFTLDQIGERLGLTRYLVTKELRLTVEELQRRLKDGSRS